MVELGAIAGVSVVFIISCLLKCAVEVGNADEHPAEVQNLLYLQCVADCLLPSGLPEPDRYKKDSNQPDEEDEDPSDEHSDTNHSESATFEPGGEEEVDLDEIHTTLNIPSATIEIQTEFTKKNTMISISDKDLSKKRRNKNYDEIYRPSGHIKPWISDLANRLRVDVSTNADPFILTITVHDEEKGKGVVFHEKLISVLRKKTS